MAEENTKYSVTVTQTAEDDLDEIILCIAEDNVQIVLKILDKLQNKINTLKYFPERGRIVPELLDKNIKEYRELIEAPWRILYTIDNNDVNIITILDGRRNVQDILIKRLLK
jgi:toxin ParE1/3/4